MKATLAPCTEHYGLSTSGWSIPKSGRTSLAEPRIGLGWEPGEDLCLDILPPCHAGCHRSAPPEF